MTGATKTETSELEATLIDRIISMYHTTRIGDTPYADHIRSKETVQLAFADLRAATIRQLSERVEALEGEKARLREVSAGFVASLTDGGRNRGTCLSINHDALNGQIRLARAALNSGEGQ